MRQLFLSYAREDRGPVEVLEADLLRDNAVYRDNSLRGGQAWWDQLLVEIQKCDIFVYALSETSLQSVACRRETDYAAQLSRPLLPVVVAGDPGAEMAPPQVAKIHWVDYRENDRSAAFELIDALQAVPSTPPLPDPLPEPPDAPLSYLSSLSSRVLNPTELTAREQYALATELRHEMRAQAQRDETRSLLRSLRSRREILYLVVLDIDETLEKYDT